MTVREVMEELELFLIAGASGVNKEVEAVYVGDILSHVISNADKKCAWITVESNINIINTACLVEASCIIITEGVFVDQNTVEKANYSGIPIFGSCYTSFKIAKQFMELGF